MDDDVKSIFIRGESGTVRKHDLPLSWALDDKLAKGLIHEVDDPDDASSLTAPEDSAAVAAREQAERERTASREPKPESPEEVPGRPDEEPGTDEHTPARPKRPRQSEPVAEWRAYAVQVDEDLSEDDAAAMSKAELIEKY